ncbi:unnamed protein product [Schistocephalus solidus]|uniref:Uncharacterized protein n=1 Tax=Schistocephalus solidus TaxID=70667 RepID=A0A183TQ56_SCHSO|nr:unnamed protein product [Schistocephalus solidus]
MPNPGAAAPKARTRDLLGRHPTLNLLCYELVVLPDLIGNINNGIWALTDRLQDSLVVLCLGAHSIAPPAAAQWQVM